MRVVLTRTAQDELASIAEFIGRDHPANAHRFIALLRDRCLDLADLSLAFPLVPRYRELGIRQRPVAGYLVFCRISSGQVEVLHIVHGARDYEALLEGERG
jgi:plasmid stabilization system protein ParE